MKTHLLQIATVEEHNIVYKNVYGNDIESYINNLISFVESDMVIDLANLLLNDNELYLTAEGIMKSDIIKDDTIKYLNREWFNEWLIETIKINYDDDVVTVDLPVNGDTLAFIMIIFNRFDNKVYYVITPLMLASKLYELNSTIVKKKFVETHLGSSIHTTHKHNVIAILRKVKEEKIYLNRIETENEIYELEGSMLI
jgi:hypothetical protein